MRHYGQHRPADGPDDERRASTTGHRGHDVFFFFYFNRFPDRQTADFIAVNDVS